MAKVVKDALVLVHWHEQEAQELAKSLREQGWNVRTGEFQMRELKASPPVALVVSLRRLPSHGREVADALWSTKWGREIRIVFFDGEPEKIEATRRKFPSAHFTAWEELSPLLE